MKRFFNVATADAERLKSRVEEVESRSVRMFDLEGTVAKAMSLLDRLPELAANTERPGAIKRLFDLRMYLSFEEVKKSKRTVNQLTGGIITIGSVAAPIEPYNGPTARGAVEKASETRSEASPRRREGRVVTKCKSG